MRSIMSSDFSLIFVLFSKTILSQGTWYNNNGGFIFKSFIMEHFRHSTVNPNVPISQLQQLSTHGWSCFICILPLPCHPHYSQPSYHFIHHYNWFKKVSEGMLKSSRSDLWMRIYWQLNPGCEESTNMFPKGKGSNFHQRPEDYNWCCQ